MESDASVPKAVSDDVEVCAIQSDVTTGLGLLEPGQHIGPNKPTDQMRTKHFQLGLREQEALTGSFNSNAQSKEKNGMADTGQSIPPKAHHSRPGSTGQLRGCSEELPKSQGFCKFRYLFPQSISWFYQTVG